MEIKKASKLSIAMYGLGDCASQFVWTFIGSYLSLYYTDVVGLAPMVVSVLMLVARIWDAINDPMMGVIAENTNTKWGRFRPYIAIGAPFLALATVLTFTNPFSGSSTAAVIYAYITYIVAGMIYTVVMIPYGSLPAVISEDGAQIKAASSVKMIGMYVGMLIVNAVTAGLTLKFSAPGATVADGSGYTKTAILYAVISIPLYLLVAKFCKEVVKKPAAKKNSVKATFKNNFATRYVTLMVLNGAASMLMLMLRIAMTPYYCIYCLNNFTAMASLMTIPSIVGIVCSFIAPYVAKWMGSKRAIILMTALPIIGYVVIGFAPYDNMGLITLGFALTGISYGGLGYAAIADAIDYTEYKTGVRTDGSAFALQGLGGKFGSAIASSISLALLSAVGYQANQAQSAATMAGIKNILTITPSVMLIAMIVIWIFWDLSDEKMTEVREELHKRHESAANADAETN